VIEVCIFLVSGITVKAVSRTFLRQNAMSLDVSSTAAQFATSSSSSLSSLSIFSIEDVLMKKPDMLLREYVQRLSDENLKWVAARLSQRLDGDLPEVLEFFSNAGDMDRWLASAKTSNDLYDMIDLTQKYTDKEYTKRFGEAA